MIQDAINIAEDRLKREIDRLTEERNKSEWFMVYGVFKYLRERYEDSLPKATQDTVNYNPARR